MKGKQPYDRKLAVERRERTEALFAYLDAYLTLNGKMPSQEQVTRDLGVSDRGVRNYVNDLVAAGRLVRPIRWESIRVATREESPR